MLDFLYFTIMFEFIAKKKKLIKIYLNNLIFKKKLLKIHKLIYFLNFIVFFFFFK